MALWTCMLAGSALLFAPPAPDQGLKVGDRIRLHASGEGGIPLVDTEGDYRGFLMMIRAGQMPYGFLKAVTIPGRLVEVVALKDDRTYALRAPAAVVRIAEGTEEGDILWVAQQYIRPKEQKPPRGEVKLPEFVFVPDPSHVFERGDSGNLSATDRRLIPCGRDRESFRRVAASLAAEDGRPGRAEGTGVFEAEPDTEVEFLYRDPSRAVVVRIRSGTHAGDVAWVPARFVVHYEVRIAWPKARRKSRR